MSKLATPLDAPAPPVAMPNRAARRHQPGRVRQWAFRGFVGAFTILVMSVAVTALLDMRDARRFPAPGDLVELSDGRMLHLHVAGEQHDGPTVVLDAGNGMFSSAFAWLQADLAEVATVVAYDRPGYGWSDRADRPVNPSDTADDLHEALSTRGLDGPYVLVGHSLGGLYVRVFADRYPAEVAGLVLLDPAHEHQLERYPANTVAQMEQMNRVAAWAGRLARLGLFRLYNPQDAALVELPDDAAAAFSAISARAGYWQATADEGTAVFDSFADAVPASFGDLPVRIISATEPEPGQEAMRPAMDQLHRELASSSPLATHQEIDGAGHFTLVTSRTHAETVANIILDLRQVRTPD